MSSTIAAIPGPLVVRRDRSRYVIIALLFLGWILGGIDRTVMNFAAVAISKDLGFNATQLGLMISAFFAGYMLMQIPGGMLADKYGPRKVLLIIVFVWSMFTGLTAVAAGLATMLVVRFMFGLGEGPFSPSAGKMISLTFDKKESAKAFSLMLSSSGIVMIVAPVFAGYMVPAVGWRNLFLIIGLAGIAVVVLYYLYLVPRIAQGTGQANQASKDHPTQYRHIFKVPMLWSLMIASFACYTLIWGFSAWMPSYLVKACGINIRAAGWLQSIPGFGTLLGLLGSGFIIDRLSERQNKYFVASAAVLCSFILYPMYQGRMSIPVLITIQTCVNLLTGYISIFLPALLIKKFPTHIVGSAMGTVLFAAQIGSFFAPFVMGMIVDAAGGRIGASFSYLFAMGVVLAISILTIQYDVEKSLPHLLEPKNA